MFFSCSEIPYFCTLSLSSYLLACYLCGYRSQNSRRRFPGVNAKLLSSRFRVVLVPVLVGNLLAEQGGGGLPALLNTQ